LIENSFAEATLSFAEYCQPLHYDYDSRAFSPFQRQSAFTLEIARLLTESYADWYAADITRYEPEFATLIASFATLRIELKAIRLADISYWPLAH
jgi:hypothetical protein